MSLRASIAYIGVRAVSGLLSVCALSLFVRVLGPEQYGYFSLGLAAAALAATMLVMPLNTTMARLYGDVGIRSRLLPTLLVAVLSLGLSLIVLSMFIEILGLSWLAPYVLIAAAVFAAAQGVLDHSAQRANSSLEARRYGYLMLIRAAGILVFGALAMRWVPQPTSALLVMALACVVSVLINMRGRLSWRGADTSLTPRIASFALPLLITFGLSYLLQWGDRYLLLLFVPVADLGRYSALADLTQQTLVLVCSGLGAAWYPRIVQAWGMGGRDGAQRAEAQRLLSRYAQMGVAIVLPAAVGFAFLIGPTATLMFGPAYADMPNALPVLLVAGAVIGASKSFYFDVPMLLAERVWRLAAGIGMSAIASLTVMVWALPRYGISGAAFGLLCGQSLGLLYSLVMGRDVLLHRVGVRQFFTVLAAASLMGIVLWLWQPGGFIGVAMRVVVGLVTYGLVLLILDFDEARARVGHFLARRP